MSVVVIGEHEAAWGIVVDRFVGEQELVLRGLDARLGKVQDVGGAALLPDGSPTARAGRRRPDAHGIQRSWPADGSIPCGRTLPAGEGEEARARGR